MAFFGLGCKGLVLQIKAHDDVGPFFPYAVAVFASVVDYGAQTGVEEVVGVLVFVEVAASEPGAVCVVSF
jgi:N-acyl-L-homoserine lactone synthetase